jgi:hypothetical protein
VVGSKEMKATLTKRNAIIVAITVTGVVAGAGTAAILTASQSGLGGVGIGVGLGPASFVASPPASTKAPANPAMAGAVAGDVITADPGTLPDGLLSYEVSAGQFIVLDPTEPLPSSVTDGLPASATAALGAHDGAATLGTQALALERYEGEVLAQTGRSAVIVYQTSVPVNADSREVALKWVAWGKNAKRSETTAPGTKEEVLVAAQGWIDSQDQPRSYQLVVTEGI